MDVSNAFLRSDLDKEVYITLPSRYAGYGQPIQPISTHQGKYVYKLLKSLYDLKLATRQWFEKLSTALLQFGFHQSKANYTLFTKKTN